MTQLDNPSVAMGVNLWLNHMAARPDTQDEVDAAMALTRWQQGECDAVRNEAMMIVLRAIMPQRRRSRKTERRGGSRTESHEGLPLPA